VAAVVACDIVVNGIWKSKDILFSDLETHLHQSVIFSWPSEWDAVQKNELLRDKNYESKMAVLCFISPERSVNHTPPH
jgi:hypothetical protein